MPLLKDKKQLIITGLNLLVMNLEFKILNYKTYSYEIIAQLRIIIMQISIEKGPIHLATLDHRQPVHM